MCPSLCNEYLEINHRSLCRSRDIWKRFPQSVPSSGFIFVHIFNVFDMFLIFRKIITACHNNAQIFLLTTSRLCTDLCSSKQQCFSTIICDICTYTLNARLNEKQKDSITIHDSLLKRGQKIYIPFCFLQTFSYIVQSFNFQLEISLA